MRPFFSIGVTTYNRKEMLKECLNSILRQTFSDFEVIVGNDYTQQSLSSELIGIDDPRIQVVNNTQNLGEINNMNNLLAMSRGRYFTWLADDDMYALTFLEVVHTAIAKFDSPFSVFTSFKSGATFHGEMENSIRQGQLFEGSQFVKLYLSRKFKAIGCYGVFDREYIIQTGGIEQLGEGFSPYSDNLLMIKAGLFEKVVYINAPLIFYRTHKESISLVSPDVDTYSTAQADLLSKSINMFRNQVLNEDFQFNLFLLLKWCVEDYFAVMRRSGKLQWRKLINYLLFLFGYIKLLKNYKYKMMVNVLNNMNKLIISFATERIRYILKYLFKLKSFVGIRRKRI